MRTLAYVFFTQALPTHFSQTPNTISNTPASQQRSLSKPPLRSSPRSLATTYYFLTPFIPKYSSKLKKAQRKQPVFQKIYLFSISPPSTRFSRIVPQRSQTLIHGGVDVVSLSLPPAHPTIPSIQPAKFVSKQELQD